ncbi:unnamed protein product [Arabidopsis lyrata]|nr:unnamed protein product [Arabidopsis lyrata]
MGALNMSPQLHRIACDTMSSICTPNVANLDDTSMQSETLDVLSLGEMVLTRLYRMANTTTPPGCSSLHS